MWPQLLALVPHITRLIPLADRYLQSRAANDGTHEEKLAQLSTALRKDLNEANASLNTQLENQSLHLASLTEDMRRLRASFESAQLRADATEVELTRITRLLKITGISLFLVLATLAGLVAQLLLRSH